MKVTDPQQTGDALEHLFLPPLKPKKKLFVWSCIVFGVWVGFLIFLYVATVYPQRHGHHAATTQPVTIPTTVQ